MMMMRMSQLFVKNSFSIGRGGWGDSVQLHGLWLFLSYITNISFPHIQIFVFHKYKQPLFPEWNIRLRRGVRSGDTRFQKCSQSGKNGSKHPMLSTSMAYSVISCKKFNQNTKKIKVAYCTMWIWLPSSEMTKDTPKTRITQARFARLLIIFSNVCSLLLREVLQKKWKDVM